MERERREERGEGERGGGMDGAYVVLHRLTTGGYIRHLLMSNELNHRNVYYNVIVYFEYGAKPYN